MQAILNCPLVWYLAFYLDMEVKGCYLAITISCLLLLLPSYYFTHYHFNWAEIVDEIQSFHLRQRDKLIPNESD